MKIKLILTTIFTSLIASSQSIASTASTGTEMMSAVEPSSGAMSDEIIKEDPMKDEAIEADPEASAADPEEEK